MSVRLFVLRLIQCSYLLRSQHKILLQLSIEIVWLNLKVTATYWDRIIKFSHRISLGAHGSKSIEPIKSTYATLEQSNQVC